MLDAFRQGLRLLHTDPNLQGQLSRTLYLAFYSTVFALVLGVVPAYRIGVSRSRAARWGLLVANAGLGLPAVGIGVFLFFILPGGATPWGGVWGGTMNSMIAGQTVLALPIVVALSAAAIRSLPDGLIDQAHAFGARGWRLALFAYREAKLGVLAAVILALGSAVAEVGAVTILGQNQLGRTDTLSSAILNDFDVGNTPSQLGLPGGIEHALAVLAVMLTLAGFLTAVQQWGALQRRQRLQALALLVDPPSPRGDADGSRPASGRAESSGWWVRSA